MARASNPMVDDPRLAFLVGFGELPIWLALAAGIAAVSLLGRFVGVVTGIAAGVLLTGLWFYAALRLERKHLKCVCELCFQLLPFDETDRVPRRQMQRVHTTVESQPGNNDQQERR